MLKVRGGMPPSEVITRGPDDEPVVALTFDDTRDTPAALGTLQAISACGIPATVFATAEWLNDNQEIAHRIASDRLEVGDHSRSHADLGRLTVRGLRREIGAGARAYERITGLRASPLFRPPFGSKNNSTLAVAALKGFRHTVLWDVDPKDWDDQTAQQIEEHVTRNVRNGSIVLLHLWPAGTAQALPGIVRCLQAEGYRFVTVSELISSRDSDSGRKGTWEVLRSLSRGQPFPWHR